MSTDGFRATNRPITTGRPDSTPPTVARSVFRRLRGLGMSRRLLFLLGAQAVTAVAGLAYGKLIAVFVAPANFGEYNVQSVTLMLVFAFLITPTIQSFMAASQQRGLVAIMPVYTRLLATGTLVSLLIISVLYVLNMVGTWVFAAWAVGLCQSLLNYSTGLLLATNQLKTYALLQGLNPVLNLLILGLVIFGINQPTATGLWLNALFLNVLLCAMATYLAHRANPHFRPVFTVPDAAAAKTIMAAYTSFVAPLLVYAVFNALNNYADRYFIQYLMTPASVGFYAVAYSLGSRLSVLGSPFVNHLNGLMFSARREGRHTEVNQLIIRHLTLFWAIGLPTCAVLYVCHESIGRLLLSPGYEPAFRLVPVIGLAAVCMYSIQLFETKFYVYEKTRYILFHSVVGAVINLSLNWLFIPTLGILGAALATLISFSAQLAVIVFLTRLVQCQ